MKRTRQKELVLQIVRRAGSHPTADEIYRQARELMPNISLGTIYRNLQQLVREGKIARLELGRYASRYESNTVPHYHIRCLSCGRIDDLPLSVVQGLNEELARQLNYRVLEHRLEVLGLCSGCRNFGPQSAADSP